MVGVEFSHITVGGGRPALDPSKGSLKELPVIIALARSERQPMVARFSRAMAKIFSRVLTT